MDAQKAHEARIRNDLAGWVMEFGDRAVPATEWLSNAWYMSVCKTAASSLASWGYLSDTADFTRGITQKGLDFIRGDIS